MPIWFTGMGARRRAAGPPPDPGDGSFRVGGTVGEHLVQSVDQGNNGNETRGVFSFWYKGGYNYWNLNDQSIMSSYLNNINFCAITLPRFNRARHMTFEEYQGGANTINFRAGVELLNNERFFHFLFSVDTTRVAPLERVQLWRDGVSDAGVFSAGPGQNDPFWFFRDDYSPYFMQNTPQDEYLGGALANIHILKGVSIQNGDVAVTDFVTGTGNSAQPADLVAKPVLVDEGTAFQSWVNGITYPFTSLDSTGRTINSASDTNSFGAVYMTPTKTINIGERVGLEYDLEAATDTLLYFALIDPGTNQIRSRVKRMDVGTGKVVSCLANATGSWGIGLYHGSGAVSVTNLVVNKVFHLTTFGEYGNTGQFIKARKDYLQGYDFSGMGNHCVRNTNVEVIDDAPARNHPMPNDFIEIGTTMASRNDGWSIFKVGGPGPYQSMFCMGSLYPIPATGKWYWEARMTALTGTVQVGIALTSRLTNIQSIAAGADVGGYVYRNDGQKMNNNSAAAYSGGFAAGDVLGIQFDADTDELTINNITNTENNAAMYTGLTGQYIPVVSLYTASDEVEMLFEAGKITGAVPSGYSLLNTQNYP